jgi:hypothetical protein
LGASRHEAVPQNDAEQEGANDPEDAANSGTDQPFETNGAEAEFKQDDGQSDGYSHHQIRQLRQAEGLEKIASQADDKNENGSY